MDQEYENTAVRVLVKLLAAVYLYRYTEGVYAPHQVP
jgi:hypothetical protein